MKKRNHHFSNSPIHEFKVLQNVFKSLKKEKVRLEMFFKIINKIRNNAPLKRGYKRISGLYAAL